MSAPRTNRPGRRGVAMLGPIMLVVGAASLGDEPRNRQLLETLPRDRRTSLAEDLERFDRLGSAEQTAIRRLDAALTALETTEPVEHARLLTLLHRYHLWFQGLPEDQQAALLGITDLDERFRAAQKIRLAEAAGPQHEGPRIAKIRLGDFGMLGPNEAAFTLKVWQKLPPEKKAEIAGKPRAQIRADLKAEAGAVGVKPEPLPAPQEKLYAAKLEQDEEFKPILQREQARHKGEQAKKAENAQKRFEHPYAEFLYFEENRPNAVPPTHLERFAESCPDWFHAMTDSLSADDARDYYTTVYRLIYPSPGEMPEPPKPPKGTPEPAAKKSPRAKTDPVASPF